MSGEQIEYSVLLMAGVLAVLVGHGRIEIGLPASNKAMMRWAGPVMVLCFAALLVSTFFHRS
jgi:hypothetical protein